MNKSKSSDELHEDLMNEGIVKAMDYVEPEDHIALELKFMHYLREEELAVEKGEKGVKRDSILSSLIKGTFIKDISQKKKQNL
jgi:TorA maturation chaperone TorD